MREDPVLAAHLVAGRCFEIGGNFAPGSIRDQMVRAYLVVQRAEEKGLISPTRPLLIIGAGPTGMTAALSAASRGVPTHVIDTQPAPGFTLSQCTSRDVEPTLYDWPAQHWDEHRFDWAGVKMPLPWTSGRAKKIAGEWDVAQKAVLGGLRRRGLPIPDFHWGTTADFGPSNLAPHVNSAGMVSVTLNTSGANGSATPHPFGPLLCGAVIDCTGRGTEICRVDNFKGYIFWETDPFEKTNCGCSTKPKALVSGGGDGALQDFIRISTGMGTKALFNGLLAAMISHQYFLRAASRDIANAEDVARRALSWNEPKIHDDEVLRRLHKAHLNVILGLRRSPAWPHIESFLRGILNKRAVDVCLLHSREFFTECYPLNRFLALLLIEVMGARRHQISEARLESIKCMHVHTSTKPSDCHGHPHEVSYTRNQVKHHNVFDVIVIRHGLGDPNRVFDGEPEMVRRRQILPYYVEA